MHGSVSYSEVLYQGNVDLIIRCCMTLMGDSKVSDQVGSCAGNDYTNCHVDSVSFADI